MIKQDQGAGLVGVFGHGEVADLADETQRAFGADHQVGEDVDWVIEIQQRIQPIARGVLEPVLVADALGQWRVGARLLRQFGQTLQQGRMAAREGGAAFRILRVQHGAIGQHDAHARQRLVAVLCRAATHAAGVVGGNATDHGRVDAGRVRPDLAAQRSQAPVGGRADDAGLQADPARVCRHAHALPAITQHDKHRIAQGLTRKAGASGAKRQRRAQLGTQGQQAAKFCFVIDHDHHLRHQAVEAGVAAPGQQAQGVRHQPCRRDERTQAFDKILVQGRRHVWGGHGRQHSPWGAANVCEQSVLRLTWISLGHVLDDSGNPWCR